MRHCSTHSSPHGISRHTSPCGEQQLEPNRLVREHKHSDHRRRAPHSNARTYSCTAVHARTRVRCEYKSRAAPPQRAVVSSQREACCSLAATPRQACASARAYNIGRRGTRVVLPIVAWAASHRLWGASNKSRSKGSGHARNHTHKHTSQQSTRSASRSEMARPEPAARCDRWGQLSCSSGRR